MKSKKDREKEKKRKQSILEKEIMSIMSKSLKTALDLALNDIFAYGGLQRQLVRWSTAAVR